MLTFKGLFYNWLLLSDLGQTFHHDPFYRNQRQDVHPPTKLLVTETTEEIPFIIEVHSKGKAIGLSPTPSPCTESEG